MKMVARRSLRMGAAALVAGLGFLTVHAGALGRQTPQPTPAAPARSSKSLVAMVRADNAIGAALIVGAVGNDLVLATASHILGANPKKIDVRFFWSRADTRPAAIMAVPPSVTLPADLKFLRVPDSAKQLNLATIPWNLIGDTASLKAGAQLFLLGQPNSLDWQQSLTPAVFSGIANQQLNFESNLVTSGHSGGAVLDSTSKIVGMIQSDEPGFAHGLPIDVIADAAKAAGVTPLFGKQPGPLFTSLSANGAVTCGVTEYHYGYCW